MLCRIAPAARPWLAQRQGHRTGTLWRHRATRGHVLPERQHGVVPVAACALLRRQKLQVRLASQVGVEPRVDRLAACDRALIVVDVVRTSGACEVEARSRRGRGEIEARSRPHAAAGCVRGRRQGAAGGEGGQAARTRGGALETRGVGARRRARRALRVEVGRDDTRARRPGRLRTEVGGASGRPCAPRRREVALQESSSRRRQPALRQVAQPPRRPRSLWPSSSLEREARRRRRSLGGSGRKRHHHGHHATRGAVALVVAQVLRDKGLVRQRIRRRLRPLGPPRRGGARHLGNLRPVRLRLEP